MSARVLLVEDHPLVRHGVRMLLEQAGMTVCGEAESQAEALQALAATHPHLLLVDLTLWEESGLDLIRALPHDASAPKVLVYSMHEDWLHVRQAFQAGAQGYVTKRELSEVVLEAIQTVLSGGVYTSPRAARAIAEAGLETHLENLHEFSDREWEIFRLLGRGLGVADLAEALAISGRTVETHCSRMLVKLGLKGMKELRLLAVGDKTQA